MEIVIATSNPHKVRELSALLKELRKFDIYTLRDFPSYHPPKEGGSSFEENAIQKASHAAQNLNCYALADDSGLVVPALSGEPGIYSSRYAGSDATDKENRQKLLKKMQNLSGERRAAYFECAIALASPKRLIRCVKATTEGMIAEQERGGLGFGYDPLFVKHEYNKSFAELSESVKNKISHRGKALDKLLHLLEAL